MDINVNVHFDENFVNALSDIAGCLAAVSVANSGNLNAHLPEKTVEPPKAPAKPAQKAEPKKGHQDGGQAAHGRTCDAPEGKGNQ